MLTKSPCGITALFWCLIYVTCSFVPTSLHRQKLRWRWLIMVDMLSLPLLLLLQPGFLCLGIHQSKYLMSHKFSDKTISRLYGISSNMRSNKNIDQCDNHRKGKIWRLGMHQTISIFHDRRINFDWTPFLQILFWCSFELILIHWS